MVFLCYASVLANHLLELVQDSLDLVDPKFFEFVNEFAIDESFKVELEFSEIIIVM